MSEIKIAVKPFKRVYLCDKCDTPVEFTGMVLTSCPPQYPHLCPKCKEPITLRYVSGELFYDKDEPSQVESKEPISPSGENAPSKTCDTCRWRSGVECTIKKYRCEGFNCWELKCCSNCGRDNGTNRNCLDCRRRFNDASMADHWTPMSGDTK